MGPRRLVLAALLSLFFISGASAAAQSTPPATPESSTGIEHYVAGDGARILKLSPDGTMVAQIDPNGRLCSFAVPTGDEIACTDVHSMDITVDSESISWAPDSSAFVFSAPAFTYLIDSDIWRFDAQSGKISDLTDDGIAGPIPVPGTEKPAKTIDVDVAPVWSPDGRSIAFSRSIISPTSDTTPTELWVVDVATDRATKIVTIDPQRLGILYYGLIWSPDGKTLYATFVAADPTETTNGVYAIDTETGKARQIAGPNPDFDGDSPMVTAIAPDGKTLVVSFPNFLVRQPMTGPGGYALLSIATGETTRVAAPSDMTGAFAITPVFSADGDALIYPVVLPSDSGGALVSRDLASGDETVVATFPDNAQPIALARAKPLIVGSNGLALVPTSTSDAYLVQLEPANSAPPVAR